MPTAIVVTVLLTHKGRGVSKRELVRSFEHLRNEILSRKGRVATPSKLSAYYSISVSISMYICMYICMYIYIRFNL